ncbi:gag/pol protein [Cucumis melo var. makuwa]|uniref:Gag/pol protein n=1 Tax=Cucumis melo var. makuwa TaxID=1194695 RepID=A0A5D3E243_CUCMM|nr:gag/pol protein [Cucumis melo var. makuwa]TYK29944.1 gag/pol protein [Cucumis melo var. makuwa]
MSPSSGRFVLQPNCYFGLTKTQIVIQDDGVEDPLFCKQAMNDVDKNHRVKAMDLETESIYFNSVWELVDLPGGVKPIGCKWNYKRKKDLAGKVQTFKAMLVAKWNSKQGLLPFRHGVHLFKEQCPKTPQEVDDIRRIPYALSVGSLMYVMLCTRPDILSHPFMNHLFGPGRWRDVK